MLDGLAARRIIGALEAEQRGAPPDLEKRGDLARGQRRVHDLLHELDRHTEHALDGADHGGLREVFVGERGPDRQRHVGGHVLEGAGLGVADPDDAVRRGARRQAERLGDVRRQQHDVAGYELEPRLVAEGHQVAHRADHPQLPVASWNRRREGAAAGVTIEPTLLDEDFEGLPDGRAAHLEARAQRVLRRDALALVAELVADAFGDLEIAGNSWTIVHSAPLLSGCLDTYHLSRVPVNFSHR